MFSSLAVATPLARRRGIRSNDRGRLSARLLSYHVANGEGVIAFIFIILAVIVRKHNGRIFLSD